MSSRCFPLGSVTPQAPSNASALDEFLLVYLDDLLVYSKSEAEHATHLHWVLQRLREHKLFAKCKKCFFGQA